MGAKARWAVAMAVVLAAGVAVWWFSNQQTIKTKRGYAVSQLRDPDSVQFRDERLTGSGWLCGEMNGKNAYGAYTGFSRFMSRDDEDVWVEGSGYVGKKRNAIGQSELLRESLRAEIEGLDARREQWDKGITPPDLSDSEIKGIAGKRLFDQKWQKNCT